MTMDHPAELADADGGGNERTPGSAWADESESDMTREPNTYLLAAARVDTAAQDDVRDVMRGLLLTTRKLHWGDEQAKRRRLIVETIASLEAVQHVVVVRDGQPGERPERRRRHCMERLLFELQGQGVQHVTFEARAPGQNRDDIGMLNALLGRHVLAPAMRIGHSPGRAEPLLWVPDAACGAVVAARVGDPTYLQIMAAKLTVITI